MLHRPAAQLVLVGEHLDLIRSVFRKLARFDADRGSVVIDMSSISPVATERLAALGISLMSSAPADCAVPPFLALREIGVKVLIDDFGISSRAHRNLPGLVELR